MKLSCDESLDLLEKTQDLLEGSGADNQDVMLLVMALLQGVKDQERVSTNQIISKLKKVMSHYEAFVSANKDAE